MSDVITLGCRLNAYESDVIESHLKQVDNDNIIVINTCAVTKEAERQARQTIRRKKKENPDAILIVTGCAAQIDPDRFAQMKEVDRVVGNEEKLHLSTYLSDEKVLVNDIMSMTETASHMLTTQEGRSRAFLQIQNGCNHRCTFCIIPYGRGNSRSVPMGQIVEHVRALHASGYQEIVLTGVDMTDYGLDLPGQPRLGQMIRRLLAQVPTLPRLRLSSVDVAEIDEDLMHLFCHELRLMPYVHISLQAGDNMILKRMKRRHTREQVIEFCQTLRSARPNMMFGADIIAGFPTETDAMFANSLALVDEAGLSFLHVFPYSAREGTPAAKMPQVPGDVRKARAAQLRAAGQAQLATHLTKRVGTEQSVIIEEGQIGRTEDFCQVQLPKYMNEVGTVQTVLISEAHEAQLISKG